MSPIMFLTMPIPIPIPMIISMMVMAIMSLNTPHRNRREHIPLTQRTKATILGKEGINTTRMKDMVARKFTDLG